jgi:transcriptional regulator with XRE-family HTH domain
MSSLVEKSSGALLGARLQRLRLGRAQTLEQLAASSGVSRAMLSKIERGEKNPTLNVAARIAAGLRISFSELVGDVQPPQAVSITPRAGQPIFRDPESGFERHLLCPVFEHRGVEFVRHVIPKGGGSGPLPAYGSDVEKRLVVERGQLEARIGQQICKLSAGDALAFRANVEHEFVNRGQAILSYYLVVSRQAV